MPGTDPQIRLAVPADAAKQAELRFRFRVEEAGEAREPRERFLARCTAWMAERLGPGSAWRCWVAESDGEPVGTIWVQLFEKMPNPVAEREVHAYISNLFVVPAARGAGLGGRLLERAIAWCGERGVDAVLLWPSAKSRPLYERHGFAVRDDLLELRHPARP